MTCPDTQYPSLETGTQPWTRRLCIAAHIALHRDAAHDASRDAAHDASRDAAHDAPGDATREAPRDATNDVRETTRDAPRDAARDVSRHVAHDASRDAAHDASRDAAQYTALNAAHDAYRDALHDALSVNSSVPHRINSWNSDSIHEQPRSRGYLYNTSPRISATSPDRPNGPGVDPGSGLGVGWGGRHPQRGNFCFVFCAHRQGADPKFGYEGQCCE